MPGGPFDPVVARVPPLDPDVRPWGDVYGRVEGRRGPQPAVVIVHGGPIITAALPPPRQWPVFRHYASLIANQGCLAVTFDDPLHGPADYPASAEAVMAVVEHVRDEPGVDREHIALWAFSGAGLLAADWLKDSHTWLRSVALTYPFLVPPDGWGVDPRFRPVEVAGTTNVDVVLTRVGLESADVARGVDQFVAALPSERLQLIDLPNSAHGFDNQGTTPEEEAGMLRAVRLVTDSVQPRS